METRELRYFVAVAEELHFGRAARRLGIAQPPLSRAIGRLERRLQAVLLERGSRAVTLTEAGAVLLREARAALAAVEAAERRTRRAALVTTGQAGVVLVTKAGASSRTQLRDGLAAVPVLDASTVTTVIAWPPHSRSRAVAGLVRTATRVGPHAAGRPSRRAPALR
ncbi:LysR family transcriptional regulator [Streptomyces hawaiiensis]|uniref:LysR family transcriptional regulator n=1 Tax=Streptomyces hawaiiensis TaxID=67305 RepID=UPI0036682B59